MVSSWFMIILASVFKCLFFAHHCTDPCPDGWVVGPNKARCFYHVAKPQSWNDSETHCYLCGGHLASLLSLPELHFAQSLCGDSCWVGGRRTNSTAGYEWGWSDKSIWNESMFPSLINPTNCTGSFCNTKDAGVKCTIMTNYSDSLMSDTCDKLNASVCVLDIGKSCVNDSQILSFFPF